MHGKRLRAVSIFLSTLFLIALSARVDGAVVGQIDTFEDGTSMGWFFGGGPLGIPPTPWTNVPNGGPAGTGDNFLQITATGGNGPGSRLSALNVSQWSGNYIAAGIGAIRMDVNNFGPETLSLRLFFEDLAPGFGPPINQALSTDAVLLPASSGWMSVEFAISPADFTAIEGTVLDALMNTDLLRIIHNPLAAFPPFPGGPPPVAAVLGVDNIQAISEPGPLALFALPLLALIALARRSPG